MKCDCHRRLTTSKLTRRKQKNYTMEGHEINFKTLKKYSAKEW